MVFLWKNTKLSFLSKIYYLDDDVVGNGVKVQIHAHFLQRAEEDVFG